MRVALVVTVLLLRVTAQAGCDVPLDATRTSFVAKVWIGDAGPFRFLIDTATSVTVLDAEIAKRVNVKPATSTQAISTGGAMIVQQSELVSVRVGNVIVDRLPILIVSLPHFRSHGRIDGILGMNFVKGRSVLLDTKRRCLDLDAVRPDGSEIETSEIAGRVALRVDSMNLVLDSGASFVVLMTPRAASKAMLGESFEMTSAAGRQRVPSATIPAMRIGQMVLRDLAAAVVPGTDPREDALLPVTLFSTIYLDPTRRFAVVK